MRSEGQGAIIGVAAAAVLNVAGMSLDAVMARHSAVPAWPPLTSAAIGALLLAVLGWRWQRLGPHHLAGVFILNAVCIAFAFALTDAVYATRAEYWVPFQGNKLGCLLAAMVAPSAWSGAVGIAIHAGMAVFEFETFAAATQAKIASGEPMATLAFALAGSIILFSRRMHSALERRMRRAEAENFAMKRLAIAFLHIRDLMNTPLQTIELAHALLRGYADKQTEEGPAVERALARLRTLNTLLSDYGKDIDWTLEDTGFDAEARLRSLFPAPCKGSAGGTNSSRANPMM